MASMSSSSSSLQVFFFFLPLIFLQFRSIPTVTAQLFPHAVCSATAGNFTTNSTYQTTLTSLFSTISSTNTISYGFFNGSSTTQTAERISAMGFCRGDVPAASCQTCLQTSATDIRDLCSNQKEAVVWNENCTFRYSNASIFGTAATDPDYQLLNTQNVTNPDQFNAALQTLLEGLRPEAAGGGSLRKFATGNKTVGFQTIFGLLQCTPDLSEQECSDCLVTIIGRIPQCCAGKLGGRVMAPSCYMRFETSRFFDGPAEALPSPPPDTVPPSVVTESPPPGSKSNLTVIIIVVVAVVAVVALVGIIAFFMVRRIKKPRQQRVEYEAVDEISSAESLQFDFATVNAATDGFSEAKKLGRGGFGSVYKGKLPNGQEIAVKRLAANSGQGEVEFKNEVTLLARLQHRNLVRLLGFCLEGSERLLIYEYVPNASLDHFLFDPLKRGLLDWESRHKIILGTARGLLYLHEDSRLRIIHRDMKASNILLDDAMNPKISDFGMARLFTQDQTRADTSRIVGTYGYMPPEYAMHGNFSVKSDVYSFGVMVLEIVSGQRNNSFLNGERVEDLISSTWRNWREGTISNIIDPSLQSGSRTEMARCIHIGLLCVQENVAHRPTMASVVLMLNSHSMTLQVPTQPGFFLRNGIESDLSSTENHSKTTSSYNDVTNTEPYPR